MCRGKNKNIIKSTSVFIVWKFDYNDTRPTHPFQ